MLAPLSAFVEFICTTGTRRLGLVRDLKLRRGYDFYAPFVAEVRAMHERAGTLHPARAAHELPLALVPTYATEGRPDARKANIFPKLAAGYAKALEALGPTTWQTPPEATVRLGELEVVAAPDLMLDVGGPHRRLVVALNLPSEPLADQRVGLTVFLMRMALAGRADATDVEDAAFGVLDVPRAHLITPTPKPAAAADMLALVRGEAAGFTAMWTAA